MDQTILTALIAAISACLGALVPSLFSYLGKRKEYKNNKEVKLEEIRKNVYNEYIDALQSMVNDGNRDNFLALQTCTNRILLFAGSNLSLVVNQYYNELVQGVLKHTPLSQDEHTKYQTDIINAMRRELGVSAEELEKVYMVRAGF